MKREFIWDRKKWIKSFKNQRNKKLLTIEEELLDKLFRRGPLDFPGIFPKIFESLENQIKEKKEDEIIKSQELQGIDEQTKKNAAKILIDFY